MSLLYGPDFIEFVSHRRKLYQDDAHSKHLRIFLDHVWEEPKGKLVLESWMSTHAINYVAKCVDAEFETVKPYLQMYSKEVTAGYLEAWSLKEIVQPLLDHKLQVWSYILDSASETDSAHNSGSPKSVRRAMVCSTMI